MLKFADHEKDLRPLKAAEVQIDGVWYLKQPDGTISRCRIFPEELKGRKDQILADLKQFEKDGRMYVKRSDPFKSLTTPL